MLPAQPATQSYQTANGAVISRWRDTDDKERATYLVLLAEPCQRLVDLNHQRAAEEAQGKIRWLRPDYQAPEESAQQGELATDQPEATPDKTTKRPTDKTTKLPWPKTLQAQISSVRNQLSAAPMNAQSLAAHYKRNPEKWVTQVLEALAEIGMVEKEKHQVYRLRNNEENAP